jgi:lipopolysaccharide export system protein LptC
MTGRGRVSGEIPAGTFSADSIRADLVERSLLLSGKARLRMVPGQLRQPKGL